jgi:NAD-dependent DNA ligase
MSPEELEYEVLVNRYLYYVLDSNLISDYEYDVLERKARDVCETSSLVHGVGSSLSTSYPTHVAKEALNRIS